jgi:hypothetical protein
MTFACAHVGLCLYKKKKNLKRMKKWAAKCTVTTNVKKTLYNQCVGWSTVYHVDNATLLTHVFFSKGGVRAKEYELVANKLFYFSFFLFENYLLS